MEIYVIETDKIVNSHFSFVIFTRDRNNKHLLITGSFVDVSSRNGFVPDYLSGLSFNGEYSTIGLLSLKELGDHGSPFQLAHDVLHFRQQPVGRFVGRRESHDSSGSLEH